MPFALIVFGLVLTVASVRGRENDLFALLKSELTGPNNFVYWFLAIVAIGSIGYIPRLRGFANAFMALVLIALLLHERGFFAQFSAALKPSQSNKQSAPANAAPGANILPQNFVLDPLGGFE